MKYKIESVDPDGLDGSFSVPVLLKEKTTHRIILRFPNDDIINYIKKKRSLNDLTIKDGALYLNIIKDFLEEDDSLYLNRLTRIALGYEPIKEKLRDGNIAIFEIDLKKFEEIEKKMKTEELELILKDGLPDLWIIH